jgi:nucleotide-binding universal stress UspA family protein
MASGQAVIGFDRTRASEDAVRAAGELLAPGPVVVVVAVEEGEAFASVIAPLGAAGLPATELEIRNALRAEAEVVRQAVRTTQDGVALAMKVGLGAEGLTVADDVPPAETLLRVAEERDARVIVVGAHRRGVLSELLVGSTAKDLLKRSPRPVLVVREQPPAGSERDRPDG